MRSSQEAGPLFTNRMSRLRRHESSDGDKPCLAVVRKRLETEEEEARLELRELEGQQVGLRRVAVRYLSNKPPKTDVIKESDA